VTDRAALDITDPHSIERTLDRLQPWAVVNTAGFVRVPEAEHHPDDCFRINTTGPELLAVACRKRGIPLVTFSSDLVFDGKLGRPYLEPDPTSPTCVYGESKAQAEDRVMAIDPDALIIRTSAFFGPWDPHNFLHQTVAALSRGEEVHASDNAVVSPTYVPDLVHATLDLLLDGERGIWHLANVGSISWHELAREIAGRTGLCPEKIRDSGGEKADTTLGTKRGQLLRPLTAALDDYVRFAETIPR
jgi:dTDP-4-dehydrorhamnose reductase